ncbi:MAG: hypothetical protein Ta2E_02810 [Mycoplasmoidaceae bacterium]|nr:MAG: hypothetical protein Ta2E_02810 [Mycoplasmoidaceae bacterium]
MKKIKNYFKVKFWTWNLFCLTVFSATSIVIVTTSDKNKTLKDFQNAPLAAEDIIFDIDNASDGEIMKHNTSIENNLTNEFNNIGLDSELVSNISDDSTLSETEKYLKLNELAAINDVNIIDKEQFSTLLPKLENVEIQNVDNLDDAIIAQAKNKIHSITSDLSQTLYNQEINTIEDLRTYSDSIILSDIDNNFDEENLALSYTLLSQYCNQFINSSKLSINDNVTICWDELFNEDNINQYVGIGYSIDVTEFLSDILLFNNTSLSSDLDVYLASDSILYGWGLQLSLSIDSFVNDINADLYLQKQKSNYFDYTFDVSFSITPPYEIMEEISSSCYEWNITNKEYATFELQPTEVYDNKNSLKLFDIVKERLVINNSFNISELENDGYGYSEGEEELRWDLYLDHLEVSHTEFALGWRWFGFPYVYTKKIIDSKAWTETKTCTINDTELSEMKEFIEHGWYAKVYKIFSYGFFKAILPYKLSPEESIEYVTNGGYIATIKNDNVNNIKNNVPLSSYLTLVNIKDENDELKTYEELIPNHHISLKLLKKREATNLTNNQYSIDYKYSITNDSTNYTTDILEIENTGGMTSDHDQQIVDQYVEVMIDEYDDLLINLDDEIQKNQLIFDNKDELKKLKDKYIYDTSVERALIITEIAVNVISSALTWITMGASVIDVIFSSISLAFDTIGILEANEDIRNINGLLEEYLSSDKITKQNQLIALLDNLHKVQKNKYDAIVFCDNLNNDMTKYINLINSNNHESSDFINFKLDVAKVINSFNTYSNECLTIGNIKNTYKKFHDSLGIITLYSSSIHIGSNDISEFVDDIYKFYNDNLWVKVGVSLISSSYNVSKHYKLFKKVLDGLNRFNTITKIDDIFSYNGKFGASLSKRYGGMIRSSQITKSKIKMLKNLNLIADISFGVLSLALNIALGIFKDKKESTYKEINKIIA